MHMDIFLVRHAIAAERGTVRDDRERPLTAQGARRFERCVAGLACLDVSLDHVFHSPWLRAVQTAELLAPLLRGRCEPSDLLADDPDARLLALVSGFRDGTRVAFVGHEPWMGELLSLCLLGTTAHADNLPFKKGGVAWLQGKPEPGKLLLRAMLPPRVLRRLASDE